MGLTTRIAADLLQLGILRNKECPLGRSAAHPHLLALVCHTSLVANWRHWRNRKRVLRRDNFTCRSCRCRFPAESLEVHHVDEQVRGGDDSLDNLVTLCLPCHRRETRRLIQELAARRAEFAYMPAEKHPGLIEGESR